MEQIIEIGELRSLASKAGLDLLHYSEARTLSEDKQRLSDWQSNGFAGEMGYMGRDPALLSNPAHLLDEVKTVVLVSVRYSSKDPGATPGGFGRVARYAWGLDYHSVLGLRLKEFARNIQHRFPDLKYRAFSDAVPLLERAWGRESGLGFIGKNTMLIRPALGSFFFIAELITDLKVIDQRSTQSALKLYSENECGSCRRCLDGCPTSAFSADRVLDSRRCISYLSIEKRGVLNAWESAALGEWIFGCDVCQELCPFNHTAIKAEIAPSFEEFGAEYGCGPFLDLKQILEVRNDEDFERRFGRSALSRTKREGLLRNACAVAANRAEYSLLSTIKHCAINDPSPVVRAQSLSSLAKLCGADNNVFLKEVYDLAARDSSAEVRSTLLGLQEHI